VSESMAHLDNLTLEQLAEETLPPEAVAEARLHLDRCTRCAMELEAYQSLFGLLEELPRFAPSLGFADAVMARVEIAPQVHPAAAWLRRMVPSSRRGWALIWVAVTAPVTPLIALVLWLMAEPLLSPATFAQYLMMRVQGYTQAASALLMETVGAGFFGYAELLQSNIQTVPVGALLGVIGVLAIGIPLSAWGLVRLTRTPMGSVSYAN
jgi:hypothetical protein